MFSYKRYTQLSPLSLSLSLSVNIDYFFLRKISLSPVQSGNHVFGILLSIIYCYTSRSRIFLWYGHVEPMPVKGCKVWTYARRSGPLSRKGSLPCYTGFSGLIRRTVPFNRLLRLARGPFLFEGPPHSIASNCLFEQGRIFTVLHLLWHGASVFRSHSKDCPI
jgi:hypothetical protein